MTQDPLSQPPVRPLVVLVGPPGAGKSTVGRKLAANLGVRFRDTDYDVAELAGAPVADIFIDEGEAAFRTYERRAVAVALAQHDGVLALGGGAVLDEDTRSLLRGQRVVFLDVEVADAARRVGFSRDRPLLLGSPRAQWLRLMKARRRYYEEVASITIMTSGSTAARVARELQELLEAES